MHFSQALTSATFLVLVTLNHVSAVAPTFTSMVQLLPNTVKTTQFQAQFVIDQSTTYVCAAMTKGTAPASAQALYDRTDAAFAYIPVSNAANAGAGSTTVVTFSGADFTGKFPPGSDLDIYCSAKDPAAAAYTMSPDTAAGQSAVNVVLATFPSAPSLTTALVGAVEVQTSLNGISDNVRCRAFNPGSAPNPATKGSGISVYNGAGAAGTAPNSQSAQNGLVALSFTLGGLSQDTAYEVVCGSDTDAISPVLQVTTKGFLSGPVHANSLLATPQSTPVTVKIGATEQVRCIAFEGTIVQQWTADQIFERKIPGNQRYVYTDKISVTASFDRDLSFTRSFSCGVPYYIQCATANAVSSTTLTQSADFYKKFAGGYPNINQSTIRSGGVNVTVSMVCPGFVRCKAIQGRNVNQSPSQIYTDPSSTSVDAKVANSPYLVVLDEMIPSTDYTILCADEYQTTIGDAGDITTTSFDSPSVVSPPDNSRGIVMRVSVTTGATESVRCVATRVGAQTNGLDVYKGTDAMYTAKSDIVTVYSNRGTYVEIKEVVPNDQYSIFCATQQGAMQSIANAAATGFRTAPYITPSADQKTFTVTLSVNNDASVRCVAVPPGANVTAESVMNGSTGAGAQADAKSPTQGSASVKANVDTDFAFTAGVVDGKAYDVYCAISNGVLSNVQTYTTPGFSLQPVVTSGNTSTTRFTVTLQSSTQDTVWCIADNTTARPTPDQIRTGKNADGRSANSAPNAQSGNIGLNITFTFSGLKPAMGYSVFCTTASDILSDTIYFTMPGFSSFRLGGVTDSSMTLIATITQSDTIVCIADNVANGAPPPSSRQVALSQNGNGQTSPSISTGAQAGVSTTLIINGLSAGFAYQAFCTATTSEALVNTTDNVQTTGGVLAPRASTPPTSPKVSIVSASSTSTSLRCIVTMPNTYPMASDIMKGQVNSSAPAISAPNAQSVVKNTPYTFNMEKLVANTEYWVWCANSIGARSTPLALNVVANSGPTIDKPESRYTNIPLNAGAWQIPLTGITNGEDATSAGVTLSCQSLNPELTGTPVSVLPNPQTTGSTNVRPANGRKGSTIITCQVSDATGRSTSISFTISIGEPPTPCSLLQTCTQCINEPSCTWNAGLLGSTQGICGTACTSNQNMCTPSYRCEDTGCQYSLWSEWSECNLPCGGGTRSRYQHLLGGEEGCIKIMTDTESCNTNFCDAPKLNPVPDQVTRIDTVSLNVQFSGIQSGNNYANYPEAQRDMLLTVSATSDRPDICGTPTTKYVSPRTTGTLSIPIVFKANITRKETCYMTVTVTETGVTPYPLSTNDFFKVTVNPMPLDCQWEWNEWTPCTASCGTAGSRSRTAYITQEPNEEGRPCRLPDTETDTCNDFPCSDLCRAYWSEWSGCTATCGTEGRQYRFYIKTEYPETCPDETRQERSCNQIACPVDCELEWSEWTGCSKQPDKCDTGSEARYLEIKVSPEGSGKKCGDIEVETRDCACTNQGTCSKMCGVYDKAKACQCDLECAQTGDCCYDYQKECAGGTRAGSCLGICGYENPEYKCFCDQRCISTDDCCRDYAQVCGGGGNSCVGRCTYDGGPLPPPMPYPPQQMPPPMPYPQPGYPYGNMYPQPPMMQGQGQWMGASPIQGVPNNQYMYSAPMNGGMMNPNVPVPVPLPNQPQPHIDVIVIETGNKPNGPPLPPQFQNNMNNNVNPNMMNNNANAHAGHNHVRRSASNDNDVITTTASTSSSSSAGFGISKAEVTDTTSSSADDSIAFLSIGLKQFGSGMRPPMSNQRPPPVNNMNNGGYMGSVPMGGGGSCNCDSLCVQLYDCCPDYYQVCQNMNPGFPNGYPPNNGGGNLIQSCLNKCGSTQAQFPVNFPGPACYCDYSCTSTNDCCPDFMAWCNQNNGMQGNPVYGPYGG